MVTLSTMNGYDNSAHNTRNLHRDGSGFSLLGPYVDFKKKESIVRKERNIH